MLEQLGQRHRQPGLVQPIDQANRQQGMPAQFEETVMAPHLLKLQYLGPQLGQGLLQRIDRCFKCAAGRSVPLRYGQGFAIDLAIGRQRQLLKDHKGRRHHVGRQVRLQISTHRLDADRLARPGEIGHQAFVPRHVFAGQHHPLADSGECRQACFDLTQLNAKATDLHLVVIAPDALQQAVCGPASEVAGAVQQGAWIERVLHELFRRQLRAVQVALGDTVAADADFAGHPQGQQVQLRIQHVDLRVGNGSPYRHAVGFSGNGAHFKSGGVGGGFGRPVAMHQAQPRSQPQQVAERRRVGTLAAAQQNTQAGQGLGNQLHILVEQRRGNEQHRRALECRAERQRVEQGGVVDHLHLTAVEQRPPDVHGAGIEGRVRGEGHAVIGIEIGVAVVEHQARDATVRHQYAFGHAGGAGGVHDVRHALRGLRQARVVVGVRVKAQGVQVQALRRALHAAVATGQQPGRAAVLQHEALAFGRRADVQRYIGGGAFENRQLADQQRHRAWQQDRHVIAGAHTQAEQVMGQAVGAAVEFAIAYPLFAVQHRQRVGARLRLCFEQLLHAVFTGERTSRSVEALKQLLAFSQGQDRQTTEGDVAALFQCLHHLHQGVMQVVAQASGPLPHGREAETFTQVIHAHRHAVVGVFLGLEHLDPLPRLGHAPGLGRTVAVVEQHAEQRRGHGYAAATLGQRQRRVFVAEQLGQAPMGGTQRGQYRVFTQVDSQRQGIDKHPHGALGTFAALQATEHHRAEHHLFTGADRAQHMGPGQVHEAGGADSRLTRLVAQAPTQPQVETHLHALIGTQVRYVGGFVDLSEHLAEKRLVVLSAQTSLGHVVAVRHGRGQGVLRAQQESLHFLLQDVQRDVVHHQMVEQQRRHHPLRLLGIHQAHQRCLGEVQAWRHRAVFNT